MGQYTIIADAAAAPQGGAGIMILMLVIIAIMFTFQWKKQKKETAKREEMYSTLAVGKKIQTIGGIVGEITKVTETTFVIKTADKGVLEIVKSAVASKIDEEVAEEVSK